MAGGTYGAITTLLAKAGTRDMTDRTRSTTLKLRLPPGDTPRPAAAAGPRLALSLDARQLAPRLQAAPTASQGWSPPAAPRGLEPNSRAILDELAALGLADEEGPS